MSEWEKVKIGEFLTESKVLAEESDAAHRITVRLNCKGVEKRGLKAEKEGATKYYTRYAGQFIYGKQNIHKGAFGIIPPELDGFTSSADLPAFDIDESKCVPEWIPLCLKVDERYKTLQKEVKGVGSQRLAVNVFLNVEIPLPDVSIQRNILAKVGKKIASIALLDDETEKQKSYAKQLRQNILQEAIEGKLTADWRKQHPVQKGNPDYDAEALFEKIRKDQKKNFIQNYAKKNDWCISELGNFVKLKIGGTPSRNNPIYWKEEIPWVSSGEVANCEIYKTKEFISSLGSEHSSAKLLPKGTVLIAMIGQGKTRGQAAILRIEAATNQNVCAILLPNQLIKSEYMYLYLCSRYETSRSVATGGNQAALSGTKISQFIFPLPPLAEQEEIVARVEQHLQTIAQLETQIATRETTTKQLMQSILKDAFEEE